MISRMGSRFPVQNGPDDSELTDNRLCSAAIADHYNSFSTRDRIQAWGRKLIHIRGLTILLAVSYLSHAILLVHNAEAEAVRAQHGVGVLLAEQMAENAGPLVQNRDTVGLGLMTDRFGKSRDVLSVRVLSSGNLTLAGRTAPQSSGGNRYTAPILLDNQTLGSAEVVLAAPARGELVRESGFPLLLSLALHGLIFARIRWPGLLGRIRVPILQPLPALRRTASPPSPTPTEPLPQLPPASTMLLQIVLDDGKGLMQRVNASTAEQLLVILEKLLHRAAKLYQGKIIHPFGPEGALVRFDGDNADDTSARALACSRLYLALADAAYQQRRAAKLFALPVKLAVMEVTGDDEGAAFDAVMQLARRGERQDLLLEAGHDTLIRLLNLHRLESLEKLRQTLPEAASDTADSVVNADSPETDALSALETLVEAVGNDGTDKTAATPAETDHAAVEGAAPDDSGKDDGGLEGPWRVLALAEPDEVRIAEQRQQILERKKAPAAEPA